MTAPAAHTAVLAGRLVAVGTDGGFVVEMDVTLRYDTTRPLEVEMTFAQAAGTDCGVTWHVSRELLVEGVTGSAGVVDILLNTYALRGDDCTIITLQPPSVEPAHIVLSTFSLSDFLARTEELVPPGTESSIVLAALGSPDWLIGGWPERDEGAAES